MKKDIARREETMPAFLKGQEGGRGKENVSKDDLVLPRIKLLQPLSDELEEERNKAGDMINSVTGQNYGKSIVFIPLNHYKGRILWNDRDNGGGIVCAAQNAVNPNQSGEVDLNHSPVTVGETCTVCKLKDWDNEAEKSERAPKCTLYYNFLIIIEGAKEPVILSMERTKVKAAKQLLSLAAYSGGNLDMFAKKYKLSVEQVEKGGKKWYNYVVEPVGFVTEAEYKIAEKGYEEMKTVVIKADTENPNE